MEEVDRLRHWNFGSDKPPRLFHDITVERLNSIRLSGHFRPFAGAGAIIRHTAVFLAVFMPFFSSRRLSTKRHPVAAPPHSAYLSEVGGTINENPKSRSADLKFAT